MMDDFNKQFVKNYRLTTAEIVYHMPDYPELLQTYIWQDYDIAPKFPVLRGFLDFWTRELDGALHTITMTNKDLISPVEFAYHDGLFTLQ